jgi:hypothetical protein
MIPPILEDVWIPKILIAVGKESHHDILDLGSSVNILSMELYDFLDLDKITEKCDIDLLLTDDSTKHVLGRVNNIMNELHMNFLPVDLIDMDMRNNTLVDHFLEQHMLLLTPRTGM